MQCTHAPLAPGVAVADALAAFNTRLQRHAHSCVVAQFLIDYLDLNWKDGLKWFDYTLVDSDVAINAHMWQQGGCPHGFLCSRYGGKQETVARGCARSRK